MKLTGIKRDLCKWCLMVDVDSVGQMVCFLMSAMILSSLAEEVRKQVS